MSTSRPHVIRARDLADPKGLYAPANHSGTANRRIISQDTVGAQHMEVLIGTIQKGHGAREHAHPDLEQAALILEGTGLSELEGERIEVGPGDWMFVPQGAFHNFVVTSDTPVKVPWRDGHDLTESRLLPGEAAPMILYKYQGGDSADRSWARRFSAHQRWTRSTTNVGTPKTRRCISSSRSTSTPSFAAPAASADEAV